MTGLEIVGHERPFGSEPREETKSRFYSNTGGTLDYVYELEGDTLTIWAGEKGPPAYYRGTFSHDGDTLTGAGTTLGRRLRGDRNQGQLTDTPTEVRQFDPTPEMAAGRARSGLALW